MKAKYEKITSFYESIIVFSTMLHHIITKSQNCRYTKYERDFNTRLYYI